MKRSATLILRAWLVLIGIGALTFLLWEPHIEGRNANATLFAIYFKDPFLAYAYVASTPFFVGLYQLFRLLGYAGRKQLFSPGAVRSVRITRYCALALIGLVAAGEVFIVLGDSDDRAGGVFIGILVASASMVVATAMAVLERALQKGPDATSENDPSL